MDLATAIARMGGAPYASSLLDVCLRYDISTPQRQAHFLAQLATESMDFRRTVESLNYSVQGLIRTFGRHRISLTDCQRLGRKTGRPAQQIEIANLVYGGEWGRENLGNTQPNDGWHFRGRGLGQHTGRHNINALSISLFADQRLTVDPDLLRQPTIAALAAGYGWYIRGCNALADRDDLRAVTRAWNGGYNGLSHRASSLMKAKRLLGA